MDITTRTQAAAWLAGMIDGEGHVRHGLRQDGTFTRSRYKCITITNTDLALLEAAQRACDLLGVAWRRHKKPAAPGGVGLDGHVRKPCYALWITGRENLIKVQKLVPLQSPAKREALEIAISSYKRIPGQKWIPDELARQRMSEGQQRRRERERKRDKQI